MTILTEGNPLIIADLENYSKWLPNSNIGEITVYYFSRAEFPLPEHIINKQTSYSRGGSPVDAKFNKMEEAEQYTQEVIAAFEKAHPGIKKKFPLSHIYFDDKNVSLFSLGMRYWTNYGTMWSTLRWDGFDVFKFNDEYQALFTGLADIGPQYLHIDENNNSFYIFSGVTQIEKPKRRFKYVSDNPDPIKINFNGPIVFANGKMALTDFKNIQTDKDKNTIDLIVDKLTKNSYCNLIAENNADSMPSGIIFQNTHTTFECIYRKVNVKEDQFIFILIITPVKE